MKRFFRNLWHAQHANRAAVYLAEILWRRSYRDASPNWKVLPDTIGAITQIDNMHAGVLRKYEELLYAVGRKYEGESRHETALRYIRERENVVSECSQVRRG